MVLMMNHIWFQKPFNFLVYGCREHSIARIMISTPVILQSTYPGHYYYIVLGTFDVQNILVTSPIPGELRVTGNFIDGSAAIGLLVIVYSLINDSDVHYLSGRVHSQMIEASVSGLTDTQYNVSIFVIEKNGLPLSRVAALPTLIMIKNNLTGTPHAPCISKWLHKDLIVSLL